MVSGRSYSERRAVRLLRPVQIDGRARFAERRGDAAPGAAGRAGDHRHPAAGGAATCFYG